MQLAILIAPEQSSILNSDHVLFFGILELL
jgi:hypothetical protein